MSAPLSPQGGREMKQEIDSLPFAHSNFGHTLSAKKTELIRHAAQ